MKGYYIILILLLCVSEIGVAQIKPLTVGDKCPDILLKGMFDFPTSTARMSQFAGKMVILDFWNIWCANCIEAIPKLEKLQQKFGDKLRIFMVNDINTIADSKARLRNNKYTKDIRFPNVVDSNLGKYFPHSNSPHIVWIGADRIVKAITDDSYVTDKNILSMINNESIQWYVKKDGSFNFERPAFEAAKDSTLGTYIPFYSGFTGPYMSGAVNFTHVTVDTLKGFSRYLWLDCSLLNLCRATISNPGQYNLISEKNKLILDVKDPSNYYNKFDISYTEWLFKNAVTYEVQLPLGATELDFKTSLKNDLLRMFGISVNVEQREVDCLLLSVIPRDSSSKLNIHDEAKFITYASTTEFVSWLNGNPDNPIIIDEINQQNVSVSLFKDNNVDFVIVKKLLNQQGYDFIETKKTMNVLVVKETKPLVTFNKK